MAKKSTINKSAITGRILSDAAAARHPKNSYKLTVMKGPVKKRASGGSQQKHAGNSDS